MASRHMRHVAIIGTGMIGEVHLRAARLAGARIVGVTGSTPARSAAAATRFCVDAFSSAEAAIASPDVDTIHICTPNASHYPLALAALEAGKHVICEKPLGLDAAQASALAQAARRADRVATVPFVYRFHPMVREARALRQSGQLGAVQLIHGSYLQDWLLDARSTNWRVDPALGGASRAFADIGSHWCDLVEWVSGERFTSVVSALTTTVANRDGGNGKTFAAPSMDGSASSDAPRLAVTTEDAAIALFRSANGVLANVTISQVSAGRKNRLWFQIDGGQASASFDQEDPERLWVASREETVIKLRDPARGSAEQRRLATLPAGHAQGYAQCFEAFVADTYATIDGEHRDGLPTFEDGVRSSHIVEAVLASNRMARWQSIAQSITEPFEQPIAQPTASAATHSSYDGET